jgi:SAM-dependent methyltransferase
VSSLIDFGRFPIHKHYLKERGEKRALYCMHLGFCESCGLSQLIDPAPAFESYETYVNLSSDKPQPQMAREIEAISRFLPYGASVIECGSNDGSFLQLLEGAGFDATGIDPAKDAHAIASAKGLNVVCESLTSKTALGTYDLFVSRQNLEHIQDLRDMALAIRRLVKPGGYALIEVPDFAQNIKNRDYAIWEEHVNYFTEETLQQFCSLAGMVIINSEYLQFSGGSFFSIARTCEVPEFRPSDSLKAANLAYGFEWPFFRARFRSTLEEIPGKIALYGAASRILFLINALGIADKISFIVDDQLTKQGLYAPGSELAIRDASALAEAKVALLSVNIENERSVIDAHKDWDGQWLSILPPSERLLGAWR